MGCCVDYDAVSVRFANPPYRATTSSFHADNYYVPLNTASKILQVLGVLYIFQAAMFEI